MKVLPLRYLALVLVVILAGACGSTSQKTIEYRTIAGISIAVDTGMNIYADRVIDGKVSQVQQDQVRAAFGKYTATARAAAAVMRSTSDTAPPDMAMAATALLNLLTAFGVKTGG